MGEMAEVAAAGLFLCSQDAKFITGMLWQVISHLSIQDMHMGPEGCINPLKNPPVIKLVFFETLCHEGLKVSN